MTFHEIPGTVSHQGTHSFFWKLLKVYQQMLPETVEIEVKNISVDSHSCPKGHQPIVGTYTCIFETYTRFCGK